MISNIVDSNGFLVFTGNDVDTKFSTVLARSGHSRIDVEYPHLTKPKWDGAKWIEGETDLEVWQKEMADSDGLMPRIWEDFLTLNGTDGWPQITKDKHISKVSLRATRP